MVNLKDTVFEAGASVTHCVFCGELLENDRPKVIEGAHQECGFRSVAGGVLHQLQRCSCFVPGATHTDPSNMTRREAARLALAIYRNGGKLPPGELTERFFASQEFDMDLPVT